MKKFLVVTALFLAVLPLLLSELPYYLRILTLMLFYISLCLSWNIAGGIAGQPLLGVSGFIGIGAYITTFLAGSYSIHPLLGIWVGGLGALALALIISPCLKLRGDFFAIGSLTVPGILYVVTYNSEPLGSCNGLTLTPDPLYSPLGFYYIFLCLAITLACITYKILSSNFGLRLAAISNDEDLASATGVNVFFAKLQSLLLTAFFSGLLGGLYAYYLLSVLPNIYDFFWGLQIMLMCITGGLGTLLGPIVGASIIYLLSQFITTTFLQTHRLIIGIILIIIILRFPKGILAFDWKKFLAKITRTEITKG